MHSVLDFSETLLDRDEVAISFCRERIIHIVFVFVFRFRVEMVHTAASSVTSSSSTSCDFFRTMRTRTLRSVLRSRWLRCVTLSSGMDRYFNVEALCFGTYGVYHNVKIHELRCIPMSSPTFLRKITQFMFAGRFDFVTAVREGFLEGCVWYGML